MSTKIQEILAFTALITVLVGLPALVWSYKTSDESAKYGESAHIITLTGLSKEGCWTLEPVAGYNYWRGGVKRAENIVINCNEGGPIVLRVTSADVVHSFSIPSLRLGPVEIKPGQVEVIKLNPDDLDGEMTFLCWQYCGSAHKDMHGIIVTERTEKIAGY